MSFTHLHVHTEYSLLDGASRIEPLIQRASELGMESLAITDHGVMFGVVDFYKAAKAAGIRPIIGCEVYTASRTRFDKDQDRDKKNGHLILLAENNEGYRNLIKIVSRGFTEGYYYKPRVDDDLLAEYSGGIIALSGCMSGWVQKALLAGDYEGAKQRALKYESIFGKGNFFLEVQNHGLEQDRIVNSGLIRMGRELGIGLVATNDAHYVKKEDASYHDVLLCIQTGAKVSDEDRMRYPNNEFYLKSEEEMRAMFPDLPEAIENTNRIAERCNMEFDFDHRHLPEFLPPEPYDSASYLRKLCEDGAVKRYGTVSEDIRKRLEYELATIERMGFVDYFLIVWDFIRYARSKEIVVGPGRGSAAGSVVAYCLGITSIDPLKYNLIFERFLNPERVSMPDIDVDFCYERRGEVIDYVVEKYGRERVSQIITFGTMKARAAVRDVGRVLDMGYSQTDALAKMIPMELGMTLDRAMTLNPDLQKAYDGDPLVREVLDISRSIEGMPRHASTHAAGVVISRDPVDEYVPLYMSDKGVSAQFNMTTIEDLGLLKMDFLGLRNLTVIRDTLEAVRRIHGRAIDFDSMEYDDPAVYKMISEGDTLGVFQLESGGMTQFMKNLSPDHFEDIIAGIALYRPGPMDSIPTYIRNKKDASRIRYVDPHLEPILSVTHGCLIYQEQVMQIVRDLAGYSYGRSDLVRRAMSKKKADVMQQEEQYFIFGRPGEDGAEAVPGCVANGIPESAAKAVFDDMVSFASYAFNKSHAAAYAVLAYETAWLKYYYPAEFMAALMTSVSGDARQLAKYIRNCRERGIQVLPPDVRFSDLKFTVHEGSVRFGFSGVKNVGDGAAREIIRARESGGGFDSFQHFIDSLDVGKVNKKAVESLIRAGAFDGLNPNRAQLMAVYEKLMDSAHSLSRNNVAGQMSLFGDLMGAEDLQTADLGMRMPDIDNFSRDAILAMEKEMLGVYVSGHPLDDCADRLRAVSTVNTEKLAGAAEHGLKDGDQVVMGAMIRSRRNMITKKNEMMAFVQVEDLFGDAEVIVFPKTYEKCHTILNEDRIVVIRGRLQFREDEDAKILASEVTDINDYQDAVSSRDVHITIPESMNVNDTLNRILPVLSSYPGDQQVIVRIEATGQRLKAKNRVRSCSGLFSEIYRIIGDTRK